MARLSRDVIEGAIGFDSTSDRADLDPKYAQMIVNMLPDRSGIIRGNVSLSPLTQTFAAQIDGLGWFYQAPTSVPKLLVVQNTTVGYYPLVNSGGLPTTYPPTFTGPSVTAGVFLAGERVRMLGFGTEVYGTQENNTNTNFRLTYGGSVFPMGIPTPTLILGTGGVTTQSAPLTAGTAFNGTVTSGDAPFTITGATNANPIIITTSVDHGYQPGDRVWVASVGGNTAANGFAYVGVTTHNTFGIFTTGVPPNYQFQFTGATIVVTTGVPAGYNLTAVGAFTKYIFTAGDEVSLISGTNVNVGSYAIIGKLSNDTIQLGTNPVASGTTAFNVAGQPVGSGKAGSGGYTSGGTVVRYNKFGVVQYSMTFVDGLGRESDLSTPVSVNFSSTAEDALITATGLASAGANGSVVSANIYATAGNGIVFYLIGNLAWAFSDPYMEDNLTDAEVDNSQNQISANFGENAPPLPATNLASDNGRIYLDATAYPGVLQISNQNSATQFAGTPIQQTDGETISITTDQGNSLNGFATFGSMFAILLRRGMYVLQGTDYTTWYLTRIHDRGSISKDSVVRADNHVVWLSDDGVYVGSYIYRFQLEKISKPIESIIYNYNSTVAGRAAMETSCAAFMDNTYYIAIGNTIYGYNFDTTGWFTLQLSGSATVTSMTAIQQQGSPGLIYVGLSDNTTRQLDIYTQNQNVSGQVFRTRLVQPDQSDQSSHGNAVETLRARTKRVRVYGSGQLSSGCTITMTCDSRTETFAIPAYGTTGYPPIPEGVYDTICYQEFTPLSYGYSRDVTLSLNGTGITIQSIVVESEVIG